MANWKCESCSSDCAEDALACPKCGQSATSEPMTGGEMMRPIQAREREASHSGLGFMIGAGAGFAALVVYLVLDGPMPIRAQGAFLIGFVFTGSMLGLAAGSAGPILRRWWHARNRNRPHE